MRFLVRGVTQNAIDHTQIYEIGKLSALFEIIAS